MVIFPYKYEDLWVFDDENVGLTKEPFVSGIPEIIDFFVKDIPDADKGFKLIFSKQPFPEYKITFTWRREQYGGHWYNCEEIDKEEWLCPALFKYFDSVPATIYCDVRK